MKCNRSLLFGCVVWLLLLASDRGSAQDDLNQRQVKFDDGLSFTVPSVWTVLTERHDLANSAPLKAPVIVFQGISPRLHPESGVRAETTAVTLVISRWPAGGVSFIPTDRTGGLGGMEAHSLLSRMLTMEGFNIAHGGFSGTVGKDTRMASSHFTGSYPGEQPIVVKTAIWESHEGTTVAQLRYPEEVTSALQKDVWGIMYSLRFQGQIPAGFHDPADMKVKKELVGVPVASQTPVAPSSTPAPSPVSTPFSLADLMRQANGSLALVTGPAGAGSGFVCKFAGQTWMITNAHVISNNMPVHMDMLDSSPVRLGDAAVAVDHDIVRFKVDSATTPALELLENVNANVLVGDEVVVLGNAEGARVVTPIAGKVVGIGTNLVEVDAPFVPGNSGSPIVHKRTGKVIGVATYIRQRAPGVAAAFAMQTQVRRFGYRLDSIKTWQTIEWPKFNAEAAALKQAEDSTLDLEHLLESIASPKGLRGVAGQQKNLALRRAVDAYLEVANAGTRPSAVEIQAAKQSFLDTARRICMNELPGLRATFVYDYFQRRATEEQAVRSELEKFFDKLYALPVEEAPRREGTSR